MRQPRCFPPPWTVEEQPACLVVGDHDGQQLAYVCRGRARARKLLTKDEARRNAANIAPGLSILGKRSALVRLFDLAPTHVHSLGNVARPKLRTYIRFMG